MTPSLLHLSPSTLGQMISVRARLAQTGPGARDLEKTLAFRYRNNRTCRLANALLGLGLKKPDCFAVLAYPPNSAFRASASAPMVATSFCTEAGAA